MEEIFQVGDIVESLYGRDKGQTFLVIDVKDDRAQIVNGKSRKTQNPKRKNLKHLKLIVESRLTELASDLNNGKPVGNERLRKAIFAVKEKN